MILVLYSKSMPCLVFQVGPLYVYIYSPERLNNISIIFRHTSLPLPFYNSGRRRPRKPWPLLHRAGYSRPRTPWEILLRPRLQRGHPRRCCPQAPPASSSLPVDHGDSPSLNCKETSSYVIISYGDHGEPFVAPAKVEVP
jgi:hypothetical protein